MSYVRGFLRTVVLKNEIPLANVQLSKTFVQAIQLFLMVDVSVVILVWALYFR